jgi:large subunit ribosomal protein L10
MVNTKKKTQVDSLTSALKENSNFLLAKIDRTSHQNLEALRKELRKTASSIKVIKNSYFEKAVNKLAQSDKAYLDLKKNFLPLTSSTMIVFLDKSWDGGLKAFHEFTKKEKTLSYKLSRLDDNLYNEADTAKIANLPGRDQLVAKMLGSMMSPMSHFVYALKYNTNKLVYILQAKSKEVKS